MDPTATGSDGTASRAKVARLVIFPQAFASFRPNVTCNYYWICLHCLKGKNGKVGFCYQTFDNMIHNDVVKAATGSATLRHQRMEPEAQAAVLMSASL